MATLQERMQSSVGGLRRRIGSAATRPARPRMPPMTFRPRRRFVQVAGFFLRLVAHIYFWDVFLMRFGVTRWYARRTALRRWGALARRFRFLAIRLGGMQIKLGQFLSSRADILPEAVTSELAGLQDEVPPAPTAYMLDCITAELGAPPEEIFATFDKQSVAAASLGQVHYATLRDGTPVAVKVQRPRIAEIIEVDLSAVALVVRLVKRYPPIRRRANLEALLEEFGRVLRQELDYEQEAINSETFRANFASTPGIYVPRPLIELSRKRVLVMERIGGIKVNDFAALAAAGISRNELAERLNGAYLKQFFLDGFFHADPHPGNLFVRVESEQTAALATRVADGAMPSAPDHVERGAPFTLIFIDFGMVGRLQQKTMDCLRDAVVGLATNDAERMVNAFDRLGAILPGADRRQIVQGFQTILRFAYDRTVRELNNLDIEKIMDETHELVFDLPFQMPQDLIYLGRALGMVGGLATMIDPDINLFQSLRPFTRQLIDRERRNLDWAGEIGKQVQELGQILLTLPRQMDDFYKSANRGELSTRSESLRLERGLRRVEQSTNRLAGGILATGLFLGGVQLRTRGLERDAQRAWAAAAAAIVWSFWPRPDGR
jgi:predicted unusual protein kinase regulating ubiquinone biosynthesis (AarF/ABC1/UbiB family)